VARGAALAAAIVVSLLAVSGAGGADAETPRVGGMVVVSAQDGASEPACLNPLQNCGGFLTFHIEEVLEGAFEIGPDRVRPSLVSRVEFTKKAPFALTFHIRPEARWSDGVPVSAKDFVFTYRAFRRYFPRTQHIQNVSGVNAIGAKTVRIVLESPFAGWRLLFGLVLPRHALVGEDLESVWTDRIDNPKTGRPIGSGPFLVERWQRGRQLTLTRNPRYWGNHVAYLDRLVLRFVSDPVEALRRGELDVHHRRADPDTERDFLQIPGVKNVYGVGRGWEHFVIQIGPGGHPALEHKLVRRALAYGLDRVGIVRAVYGGFVPKMLPSDSAVLPPNSPYHQANWSSYRFRPATASRLLEQAGCRRGNDAVYVCAGERLSLRLVTLAGIPRRKTAVELAQAQLRQAGVEVLASYVPPSNLGEVLRSDAFDLFLYVQFYPPDPVGHVLLFGCGGRANAGEYCQRIVTRDLDQADRILDPDQRARVLNRADRQMASDVPVIPLWNEPAAATVRSTIRGFEPSFPSSAWNAENWWLER